MNEMKNDIHISGFKIEIVKQLPNEALIRKPNLERLFGCSQLMDARLRYVK